MHVFSASFSTFSSNSPYLNSDDSIQTLHDTNSTLKHPAIDTPDEFLHSEPSPANFSKPLLKPITTPSPLERSTSSSSHTDATPKVSPLSSHAPDVSSLMTDDHLEKNRDDIIENQQKIHNDNNPLIVHRLTSSASTSESSP